MYVILEKVFCRLDLLTFWQLNLSVRPSPLGVALKRNHFPFLACLPEWLWPGGWNGSGEIWQNTRREPFVELQNFTTLSLSYTTNGQTVYIHIHSFFVHVSIISYNRHIMSHVYIYTPHTSTWTDSQFIYPNSLQKLAHHQPDLSVETFGVEVSCGQTSQHSI